jgi:hypothetical protein
LQSLKSCGAVDLSYDDQVVNEQPSAQSVRKQVKRLIAHPLFTNSKRYPVLLAYVVEQTLLGNASQLKERTIGVEAFGRTPDYDVNADAIVRTTAAEVRRRLAQYYHDHSHAPELVIELPLGSYVPTFRDQATSAKVIPQSSPDEREDSGSRAVSNAAEILVPAAKASPSGMRLLSAAGAIAAAALLGFFFGSHIQPRSDLDRFWEPMISTPNRISYCLGAPINSVDRARIEAMGGHLIEGLDETDVATLARLIAPPVSNNHPFRIVSASDVPFAELREGPIVLIGAFDNSWTMRITQSLPFSFSADEGGRTLVDHRSSPNRKWATQSDAQKDKRTRDYAIVARIHDDLTGQPVIVVAGIHGEGTEAAGEAISDPSYLKALVKNLPSDWTTKNFEAIIQTNVIDGHAGAPSVVTETTW